MQKCFTDKNNNSDYIKAARKTRLAGPENIFNIQKVLKGLKPWKPKSVHAIYSKLQADEEKYQSSKLGIKRFSIFWQEIKL